MNQSASQMILVTPPDRMRAASAYGLPIAHMAYRLGSGSHLFRANFPAMPQGGLMMIGEDHFDGYGDGNLFCREVLRECSARKFSGVVFDLESHPTPALARIISSLSEQTARRGWSFYLPESYSNYSNTAKIMISAAISGGTLRQRLKEVADRYGHDRIVLCIDRSAEDFYLPAPKGSGKPLSRDELHKRIETLAPSVFFSNELCAHYFTYMNRDSGAHFILFDDLGSIRQKISMAEEVGIHRFFLFYSQMDDLLPDLLGTNKA
jgi:hypothetical protein